MLSSAATHSCSFEYLSPGGASIFSSNRAARLARLKQSGAADIMSFSVHHELYSPSSAAPERLSSADERSLTKPGTQRTCCVGRIGAARTSAEERGRSITMYAERFFCS